VIRGSYPAIPAEYSKELAHMVKTLLNVDQVRRGAVDSSRSNRAAAEPFRVTSSLVFLKAAAMAGQESNHPNLLVGVDNAVHCLREVVFFRGNCLGLKTTRDSCQIRY
jgi:hypothetical protein